MVCSHSFAGVTPGEAPKAEATELAPEAIGASPPEWLETARRAFLSKTRSAFGETPEPRLWANQREDRRAQRRFWHCPREYITRAILDFGNSRNCRTGASLNDHRDPKATTRTRSSLQDAIVQPRKECLCSPYRSCRQVRLPAAYRPRRFRTFSFLRETV